MKLSNLKTWLPGMILGLSLLTAVPVSADNLHSENPPPEQFERLSSTENVAADATSHKTHDPGADDFPPVLYDKDCMIGKAAYGMSSSGIKTSLFRHHTPSFPLPR